MIQMFLRITEPAGQTVNCIRWAYHSDSVTDLNSLTWLGEEFYAGTIDSCRHDTEFSAKTKLCQSLSIYVFFRYKYPARDHRGVTYVEFLVSINFLAYERDYCFCFITCTHDEKMISQMQ